jgi:hypothetical protein
MNKKGIRVIKKKYCPICDNKYKRKIILVRTLIPMFWIGKKEKLHYQLLQVYKCKNCNYEIPCYELGEISKLIEQKTEFSLKEIKEIINNYKIE